MNCRTMHRRQLPQTPRTPDGVPVWARFCFLQFAVVLVRAPPAVRVEGRSAKSVARSHCGTKTTEDPEVKGEREEGRGKLLRSPGFELRMRTGPKNCFGRKSSRGEIFAF